MAQTRNLGRLQEDVLYFLAENPDNHKQGIQKGIGHPSDQYGSVLHAVDALEKLGLIISKEGKSKKNVSIKFYYCTEEGVFYALARNPNANILRILDSYKNRYDVCKSFRGFVDVWGIEFFMDVAKNIDEFLIMIQKEGLQKALPFIFMKMKMTIDLNNPDPKERKKRVRETMQKFPQLKPKLKEWVKSVNELVGE